MYIKIATEPASDGKHYATGWSVCEKHEANDSLGENIHILHIRRVFSDFFANVRYWYILQGELRKNPHRVLS